MSVMQLHTTRKGTHPAYGTYNRGYTLEMYSLAEVQQFSTAFLKAPDDDQSGDSAVGAATGYGLDG
jgi:hypothetical protein